MDRERNSRVSEDFVKEVCIREYKGLEEAMNSAEITIYNLEYGLSDNSEFNTKEELAEIITDNIKVADESNMSQAITLAEKYIELCSAFFDRTGTKLSFDIFSANLFDPHRMIWKVDGEYLM